MFRQPPISVRIHGRAYRINPDFRIFAQMESDVRKDKANIEQTLQAFYRGSIPEDIEVAVERLLWFYRLGEDDSPANGGGLNGQRAYDYEQDMDAIYQSFMQDYHIDLYACSLHWWKFCRLCAGLSDDTPFKRLVYIRTADVSKMPPEQRTAILQARERCRICDRSAQPETLTDYENAMVEQLKKAWNQ